MNHVINPRPARSPVECVWLLSSLSIIITGKDRIEYGRINVHIKTSFQKYGHKDSGILEVP